jgi:photosystem II stability/assembly factor-like uncharacterized protein
MGVFVYYFFTKTTLKQNQRIATVTSFKVIPEIDEEAGEEEGGEQKLRNAKERKELEFEMTKDPKLDRVPIERLITAKRTSDNLLKTADRSGIGNINWEERGPNNVGGRTRAILIDAADPTNNTLIAGGVNGGIWRTTNFMSDNPSWKKADDFFENLAVSAIVQDPVNPQIIYFGTGEGWFSIPTFGLGIWKSEDGGKTYQHLTSTANPIFNAIQDLKIDKNGVLYAATASGGVQASSDGGATWRSTLGERETGTSFAADIEVASNGDIYVAFGRPFALGSIWKSSVNKGAFLGQKGHWKNVTPPQGSYWRIELASAPSNPWVIYAVCEGENSFDTEYIFRSDDGGRTWSERTVPTIYDQGSNPIYTRNQAWYDLIAAVHPEDENEIWIGGIDGLRSRDGGVTWQQISDWTLDRGGRVPGLTTDQFIHADHHEIIFMPHTWGKEIVFGTDGGISHGTNLQYKDRLPIFRTKNHSYNITQFYSVAVHPTRGSNYFLAGSQDNGTQQFRRPGINSTFMATGGDGGFCHIDQKNPLIQITAFTGNNLSVSQNGGKSFAPFFRFGGGSFINPSDYDNDTGVFYAGFENDTLFRWNDLGAGSFETSIISGFSGITSAVSVDPSTPNRVWIGYRSRTTGTSIAFIDDADGDAPIVTNLAPPADIIPGTNISCIEIDPNNPSRLLVTLSNYGIISVFEVTDADADNPTWTAVEGNLPDFPVRWATFMPNSSSQILLATELGVWGTERLAGDDTQWRPTNKGLANTRIDMFQKRASDGLIAAATHGRGLFTAGGGRATCNDGIQNGDETGVDCGGSCAPCKDYCEAGAATSHFFGIGRVAMGGFENITGNDAGYGDYTHLTIPLNPGESIFFELEPNGFRADLPVFFTLWIDYNKDLDFDDEGETVFIKSMPEVGRLYQTFKIPEGLSGETRMRISMSFFGPARPCDGYLAGETEDYTVYFKNCGAPENISCTGLFGNKVIIRWDEVQDATSYELQYRIGYSNVWKTVKTARTQYNIHVRSGETITYRVRSICPIGPSVYSDNASFRLGGGGFTANFGDDNSNFINRIYPNPIQDNFTIEYQAKATATMNIIDASGKQVLRQTLAPTVGIERKQINVANWAAGTYVLSLKVGEEVFTKSIIKK